MSFFYERAILSITVTLQILIVCNVAATERVVLWMTSRTDGELLSLRVTFEQTVVFNNERSV